MCKNILSKGVEHGYHGGQASGKNWMIIGALSVVYARAGKEGP